ncbi:MAG: ABC transporter ATP-binding protein [Novosphingobium sp.]|nr:ABC transporter ATP-binding protein [Novosphingobium sp.]
MRDLWQLMREALPYRRAVIALALLALVQAVAALALPWLGARVLGLLLQSQLPTRGPLVLGIFALLAAGTAASVLSGRLSARTSAQILAGLRLRMYAHLQALPLAWHDGQSHGSVLALVTEEVGHLGAFITGPLVRVLPMLVTVAGAFVLIVGIDPVLGLIFPILVPAYTVVARLVGRTMRRLAEQEQQAEAQCVALADENLTTIFALKSFAREQIETARYAGRVARARDISVRIQSLSATVGPVLSLVAAVVTIGLLLLAGQRLQGGTMALQQFIALLLYTAALVRPVGELVNVWGQLQTTLGTLRRLRGVLDTPVEPGYGGGAALAPGGGEIRFENVTFAYPNRGRVVENFSCTIAAGEAVSLSGSNGAGKSTLIALLLRLYELGEGPEAGRILIDGQDIAGVQVQDLRRQVALVPQRPQLLNSTIRDNIAYGAHGASEAQILHAAQQADAMGFIASLPEGMDTVIGDRGVRLSGGQGQRIALARALLKDARIYVLDEATSMYDAAGEQRFVERCAAALAGKTLVIIAHRPVSLGLVSRTIAV